MRYMKMFELQRIQDKLEDINCDFIFKMKNHTSGKGSTQPRFNMNILNNTNRMEPMCTGPSHRNEKEI